MLAGDEATEGAPGEKPGEKRPRPGRAAADAGMRLRLAVVVSQCLELML